VGQGWLYMSAVSSSTWFHSNRYTAQSACEHCGGVIRHESWCITMDPVVYYAYEIVIDPTRLTLADSLILHALGVSWTAAPCSGRCGMAAK
jgi:hypothetical protein